MSRTRKAAFGKAKLFAWSVLKRVHASVGGTGKARGTAGDVGESVDSQPLLEITNLSFINLLICFIF